MNKIRVRKSGGVTRGSVVAKAGERVTGVIRVRAPREWNQLFRNCEAIELKKLDGETSNDRKGAVRPKNW